MSDTKMKGKLFGKSKLVSADLEKTKTKVIKYYNKTDSGMPGSLVTASGGTPTEHSM